MTDDQLTDLKQFILATVSQTEARLESKIDSVEVRLSTRIDELNDKMDDGFAGVGEAIEQLHQQIEERDDVVEGRLAKLEQHATAA
jgi:hypothetical protein